MEGNAITRSRAALERELTAMWAVILGIPESAVSVQGNFFAMGGQSLHIVRLMDRVNARYFANRPEVELPVTDFFDHSSIDALVQHLLSRDGHVAIPAKPNTVVTAARYGSIAVIGMSGRFPQAPSVEKLWSCLLAGQQCIQEFTREELLDAGVSESLLNRSDYVRRGGILQGCTQLDADYFGLTPREAAMMSPQHRLLLECSEEALQHAGHGVRETDERVGVYLGAGHSDYPGDRLDPDALQLEAGARAAASIANSSPATRISYLLKLTGPSLTIDTACSSSLVAVHLACGALNQGECDMALAGGATVREVRACGYRYETGGVVSSDGYCRPFDAHATGTVFTNGGGVVLLKRLADAIADGDVIHAVIRGSAINNDGGHKAGYTAPSATGQAQAIRTALAAAQVEPDTIHYIEAHGTGTQLGDPIEVSALREVFGSTSRTRQPGVLGSLKGNFGHMQAGAGIAGLIKAVLAVSSGEIPPTVNYQSPNAEIDLESLGFRVSDRVSRWPEGRTSRRAAVSSFGIGGTNAHAIVEEPPARASVDAGRGGPFLLVLSARTRSALVTRCREIAATLSQRPCPNVADVAYTLQVGQQAHEWRCFVVASDASDAARLLLEQAACGDAFSRAPSAARPLVLMFPQVPRLPAEFIRNLYEQEPVFRDSFDHCAQLVSDHLDSDLRELLLNEADLIRDPFSTGLELSAAARAGVFAVEYSLARLLRSWGIEATAMIGDGVGAWVAACLSGLASLESALIRTLSTNPCLDGVPRTPFPDRTAQEAFGINFDTAAGRWLGGESSIFLETGTGRLNAGLRQADSSAGHTFISCAGDPRRADDLGASLLTCLGQLWQAGVLVDWHGVNFGCACNRAVVPTYPFEQREHWIPPPLIRTRELVAVHKSLHAEHEAAVKSVATAQPVTRMPHDGRARLQETLVGIWSDLLGVSSVGVHDNFFDLGGDSLLAIQLNAKVTAVLGCPVHLKQLIARPTIAQLAELLTAEVIDPRQASEERAHHVHQSG